MIKVYSFDQAAPEQAHSPSHRVKERVQVTLRFLFALSLLPLACHSRGAQAWYPGCEQRNDCCDADGGHCTPPPPPPPVDPCENDPFRPGCPAFCRSRPADPACGGESRCS